MICLGKSVELNLQRTLNCGQCFCWRQEGEGHFYGMVCGRAAHIWVEDDEVLLESSEENSDFWNQYFGLELNYKKIIKSFRADAILQKCISSGYGIRILRQDAWEATISFICSANNNIPRIEKILHTLCMLYGDQVEWQRRTFYTFPSPKKLAGLNLNDLAPLRAGYRDKYILGAARMIADDEINFEEMKTLATSQLRQELCRIPGVGPKVADCIMLFGMGRYEVFPKDVWTKRILQEIYQVEHGHEERFVTEAFGQYAGIAQQYLYYYFRKF